jgi:hypothetical protein
VQGEHEALRRLIDALSSSAQQAAQWTAHLPSVPLWRLQLRLARIASVQSSQVEAWGAYRTVLAHLCALAGEDHCGAICTESVPRAAVLSVLAEAFFSGQKAGPTTRSAMLTDLSSCCESLELVFRGKRDSGWH